MKVWAQILAAVEAHGRCALVSVVKTEGSAPRDAGARMVVTPEAFTGRSAAERSNGGPCRCAGATRRRPAFRLSSHALGPELGQCCGGRVQLAIESFDRRAANCKTWQSAKAKGHFRSGAPSRPDIVEHFWRPPRSSTSSALGMSVGPWCWHWHRFPSTHLDRSASHAFPRRVPAKSSHCRSLIR